MINITNSAIVEKIKGTGRTFTLSIKVGTNTFTKVKSLRRSSIFASNQKLSVGEAVSAFIEAEINDCRESLQNYEVEPILSIDGYNIPLGIFKVQAPSQADGSGTQKITAYDRMSETSKFNYTATGLTSAISTFSKICNICGFTAITSGLTDVAINDRLLDGMTCREALGYVAGVFGKNCVVTTDGKFKMLGYSKVAESTCKISINSLDTLEFPSKVSTIDYFNAVVDEATTYKSGTGNNGVNVVNPLFKSTSQTYSIFSQLQANVGSNGYYPAKFKQLNGDPRIEVGDVIKVEHRNIVTGEVGADYVPVMSSVLDYDGGVTVSIEAYATESEFSMSLSDKMNITNSSNNNKFGSLGDSIDDVNSRFDGFEEDIEGANTKADFAVIQAAAVEELNKVIGNSLGLYQTKIKGTGGDEKYYFHNKSTLESSTYIISMTDKGFAFANSWNNGNPVWTYGINPAGNSIMNYLVVNKISADLIEAGVIKSLPSAEIQTSLNLNDGTLSFDTSDTKVAVQASVASADGTSQGAGFYIFDKNEKKVFNVTPQGVSFFTNEYAQALIKYLFGGGEKPEDPYFSLVEETSMKTKHLHCQDIYILNKDSDVEEKLTDYIAVTVSAIQSLTDRTDILETEVARLKEALGTKSLVVYVNANPSVSGYVSGSGSYTLEDESFVVTAYPYGGTEYYISNVVITYLSDGSSQTFDQATLINRNWLTNANTRLDMPVDITASRLGDTANVVVNFGLPEKYNLTLNVDPAGSGTVTGSGSYYPDTQVRITATPKSGYKFDGWYENGSLKSSDDTLTITMSSDRTLTAKFETEKYFTAKISSSGASSDDTVYISGDANGSTNYGTEESSSNTGTIMYYFAKAGSGRVISKIVTSDGQTIAATNLVSVGALNSAHTQLAYPAPVTQGTLGKTVEITVHFKDVSSGELTITAGETKSVNINADEITYLKFIPSVSGTYEFTSLGGQEDDVVGYLYDANKSQLAADDDSAGNRQFLLTQNLTAGTTYYWGVKYYDTSKSGSVNVKLTYKDSSGGGGSSGKTEVYIGPSDSSKGSVTFTLNGVNAPYPSGKYALNIGDTVTATATPNSGYNFWYWFRNNDAEVRVSSEPTYTFTVSSDITHIMAAFM